MTTFNDRENAFEAHYALDQEQEFKAQSRRNRMLALWAGERLGLAGDDLQAYGTSVIRADFKEAGDDDVFQKVAADFAAKGVDCQPAALRAKMDELLEAARREIKEGR